jgi:toxin ParE1/3/4
MSQLKISDQAKIDLLEIWLYIAENSQKAADRVVNEITNKFDTLVAFPRSGRSREDLGAGLRSTVVGKYVIYYRRLEDGIEIFRVLHGARNVDAIFEGEGM